MSRRILEEFKQSFPDCHFIGTQTAPKIVLGDVLYDFSRSHKASYEKICDACREFEISSLPTPSTGSKNFKAGKGSDEHCWAVFCFLSKQKHRSVVLARGLKKVEECLHKQRDIETELKSKKYEETDVSELDEIRDNSRTDIAIFGKSEEILDGNIQWLKIDDDTFEARPPFKPMIESSFTSYPDAIGSLRMPVMSNGRYETRHPIIDMFDDQVGALVNGALHLGYTYGCVYSDEAKCFFIVHSPFREVRGNSASDSLVSFVDKVGKFFWGKGDKYERTGFYSLPDRMVEPPLIFRTMNSGIHLLFLSKVGFFFLDMPERKMLARVDFRELRSKAVSHSVSPVANVIAVAFSYPTHEDPIDAALAYESIVRLYRLEDGSVISEHKLPGQEHNWWKIVFSSDGRKIQATAKEECITYELNSDRVQ